MINLVPNNVLASWWPLVLAVIPVWWHDFQILTKKVPLQGGLYFLLLWVFLSHTTCAPEHVWTLSHEFPQHRTPQLKRISFGRELLCYEQPFSFLCKHSSNDEFHWCNVCTRAVTSDPCTFVFLRVTRVRVWFLSPGHGSLSSVICFGYRSPASRIRISSMYDSSRIHKTSQISSASADLRTFQKKTWMWMQATIVG